MRPSTQARDRPSAGTERVRMTSRAASPCPTTKRASTKASVAPARTMPGLALPPSTSCSASTTSVLPAPVSPVSTVMPGPKTSVRSSITPRSRTCRSVSTGQPLVGRSLVGRSPVGRSLVSFGQEPEAQNAPERLGLVAHDAHRALGHGARDGGARLQPPDLLPVNDENAGPVGHDLDGDLLVLGQ